MRAHHHTRADQLCVAALGRPDRFVDRMTRVDSTVLLRGPYGTPDSSNGIDRPNMLPWSRKDSASRVNQWH
jgi:hypothetical protein